MKQWLLRVTAYADRLINGLDNLDWSESIKEIQRNWIGKSFEQCLALTLKDIPILKWIFSQPDQTQFSGLHIWLMLPNILL